MLAACVLEGAEDKGAATAFLHMVGKVLTGDVGCATLVRALHWEARAVVLVVL